MRKLQQAGGIAALIEAVTFVVGFALLFTVLAPTADDGLADQRVAFFAENQAVVYAWNAIIYVLFGIALVVLALALYERLRAGAQPVMQIATAFGVIWAGLVIASGMVASIGVAAVVDLFATDIERAALIWQAISPIQDGLGGGNEIVGGIWVLLVSWAALRVGTLPAALSYLGMVIGAAGMLTIVPPIAVLGAVFGLGLIVWFAWLGIVLLRTAPSFSSEPQSGNAVRPSTAE